VLQLAQLVEECRQRRIIDPPPRRPERLYIGARYPAPSVRCCSPGRRPTMLRKTALMR
jgi:hypothetical protein